MSGTFKLALKNLTRQKRRNAILAIAIAFGFFVITFVDGLITGMVENLEKQLTQLLGGTVLIQGEERIEPLDGSKPSLASIVRDDSYIRDVVEKCNIDYEYLSFYSMTSGQMIFEGKKSIITVYGRELMDKNLLESFQFASGGTENFSWNNALIISDSTANSMNLEVGDKVTFTCQTIYGQNNVDDFTVAGIIKSNNFFGSLFAYTDIKTLNNLLGIPEAGYSTFSIYLKDKNKQALVANQIEEKLRNDGVNVTSRMDAFKTNPKNIGMGIEKQLDPSKNKWEGTKYAVETFNDELPQIQSVLSYVHLITTIILLVILFIVMIGVSNTYRMVLYERIREIGTMRALGLERKKTKRLFTLEAVLLCVFGALCGLLISFVLMLIVKQIPINFEPLSIFLNKGHLSFSVSVGTIIFQYILLIILTMLAVNFTASKASKMSPAQALRTLK